MHMFPYQDGSFDILQSIVVIVHHLDKRRHRDLALDELLHFGVRYFLRNCGESPMFHYYYFCDFLFSALS